MEEKKIKIGKIYDRKDGLKAFVYRFDNVLNEFCCIILHTGEVFCVYEDGKYYQNANSHNDLVL